MLLFLSIVGAWLLKEWMKESGRRKPEEEDMSDLMLMGVLGV